MRLRILFTLILTVLPLSACGESHTVALTNTTVPATPESTTSDTLTETPTLTPTFQPTEVILTPETLDRDFEDTEDMQNRRNELVDYYVAPVVEDERVIEALRAVPRHSLIPTDYLDQAYNDYPLPIGYGQTISQPSLVAMMTDLLEVEPGDKVLEIGTGSGYQAAILAELTGEVYTVEIIPELASMARAVLDQLGYDYVHLDRRDGYFGWREHAPFDAIIVTAAPDHLPAPLVEQLNPDGGRMVIPIGPVGNVQTLWLVTRENGEVNMRRLLDVRFVPFTREEGE